MDGRHTMGVLHSFLSKIFFMIKDFFIFMWRYWLRNWNTLLVRIIRFNKNYRQAICSALSSKSFTLRKKEFPWLSYSL